MIPKTNLADEDRYLTNHHKMMQEDEEYYWEYVMGGKTGFTSQCLNTLVTYAQGRRTEPCIGHFAGERGRKSI